MSATQPILETIRDQLLAAIPIFSVELFPDDLEHYYLKDEAGAILIQYAGSKFDQPSDSTDIINQRRIVHIAITILARSQHNDQGALAILDQVRLAVVGFRPLNCTPCHLVSEEYAGEAEGIWQYQLIARCETWQVQQVQPQQKPQLSAVSVSGRASINPNQLT